jgi:hypothetical protein
VGLIGTGRRDAAQQRREARKRRADKFEEVVAAVYEFDHWVEGVRQRETIGVDIPETVSPFAKVEAISSIYFPQFDGLVRELNNATTLYRMWIQDEAGKRIAGNTAPRLSDGFVEAYQPYSQKRDALLNALTKFARDEFQ